jgi:D-alanyl-D-alanine carboxypeptidase/D-alanyl-D-alanine-endopeptidase (penicillin-binding protein 4)
LQIHSLLGKVGAAALVAFVASFAARADLADDARTLVGAGQGVYVEAEDGTVLVAQAADVPVHPASVSKVPTTLALLRQLGPDHRFETRFRAGGPFAGGVVAGDLVVEGSGDPFFVDENAVLVANALHELGVRRVAGDVVVRGPLLFDWETKGAAGRLERVLAGGVPKGTWEAVRGTVGGAGDRPPRVEFGGAANAKSASGPLLVVHRSEPLLTLVKSLNGFSNNIFATFAQSAGGIAEVESIARASVPAAWRGEIVLGDGAGENRRNRLSPRAAVALLRALAAELAKTGHTLDDVLPVAGIDEGTLRRRFTAADEVGRLVGKTGTYADYGASALAGVLRTRERGLLYFAVLNHGVPTEPARKRQDAFVRALLARFDTEPWNYVLDSVPAFTRAQVERAAGG